MSGKATAWLKKNITILGIVLSTVQFFFCPLSNSQAAITWSGSVSPSNPAGWTSGYIGYIGKTSAGTVTVNAGSILLSKTGYLGYSSGTVGTATITGSGSKWINSEALYIGCSGSGTLTVSNGGEVATKTLYASLTDLLGDGIITANGAVLDADLSIDGTHGLQPTIAFGTGGAINFSIDGSSSLGAGYKHSGTLRIADGIAASSPYGYLGYYAGSTGAATVTGSGSKWTNGDTLYVGYWGNGTLSITAGGEASDATSYLGYYAGSTGAATVTGAGSKWTNNESLYLGYTGSGTLTVADGGAVFAKMLYASLNNLFGNGAITATQGAVLDADLVFDAAHGQQQTIAFGSGGTLNLNFSESGTMGVGYKGVGTLRIAEGIAVATAAGYLGYLSGSSGTATVSGADSKWTTSGNLYVGYKGNSALTIEAGGQINNVDSYLGYYYGSAGTATVTGTNSKWTNSWWLHIGGNGSGTLNVEAGGQVITSQGSLGYASNAGTVRVVGGGSKWTNTNNLYIGEFGDGTLNIEGGGQVSTRDVYLGYNSNSSGTVTVTGTDSLLTGSGFVHLGHDGDGMLNIQAGGQVSFSGGSVGCNSSSHGTVTVTGTGSKWINNGTLYLGNKGSGSMTVSNGGTVSATTLYASLSNLMGNGEISVTGLVVDANLVFDAAHGLQQTIAFGSGGRLNLSMSASEILGAGYKGSGTLRIADGMAVSSYVGYLGYVSGSAGTATVTGSGSKWTNGDILYVGYWGNGTLSIEAGGEVRSRNSCVGLDSSSPSTATVTGAGSKWINSGNLTIGHLCDSTLKISAGGQVSNANGYVGNGSDRYSTATVTDTGSQWINSGTLYVGYGSNGMLYIQAGGQVSSVTGYLANDSVSYGFAYVSGAGSKWTNSGSLYVNRGELRITAGGQVNNTAGYIGCFNSAFVATVTVTGNGSEYNNSNSLLIGDSGNGYLTISGGRVTAMSLILASSSSGSTYCNLQGGTLQAANISRGTGTVNFNWNDGTIRNYDANTDLSISQSNNLVLKLASTGTHAFHTDLDRTGTVDAVLCDATSGGTLKKIGAGTLVLTAANTYSGGTTVEEGRFKVTGSILNTSSIRVSQGAILELAKYSGSATVGSLAISNEGTVLISAGTETVGTIGGIGITQVTGSASLTAASITQNTLTIGIGAAGAMSQVPEPSTLALLGLGGLFLFALAWRRRERP